MLHSRDNISENCVARAVVIGVTGRQIPPAIPSFFPIEEVCHAIGWDDVELAAIGVFPGVCCSNRASCVLQAVLVLEWNCVILLLPALALWSLRPIAVSVIRMPLPSIAVWVAALLI